MILSRPCAPDPFRSPLHYTLLRPKEDHTLTVAEPGDQLIFESDGMVFESYPAQLGAPYEVRHKGSLTDEELRSIDVELPTEKAAD